jgi:predicted NodU family carbamoyl transferase
MGEPIVETPADAVACLLNSGLDCCVFEDTIVERKARS